ncbi:hypothetical protein JXA31_01465 [Candidatus Bathyarchaeota archaeon]|nr:hypothetical protein [Candidatus Bathyarchaeota archaeon]
MHKSILFAIFVIALIGSLVTVASAYNWNGSLESGYAVTSNYHGIDVPSGAKVVVTAMTTDWSVDKVTFIWKNPAGQVVFSETKQVYTNGTKYAGKLIRYANSTFEPNAFGDWGVQAKFLDVHRICRCIWTEKVAKRATSFNVIPEVPIIGTAGASIAMLLGLTYKLKRKSQK